MRIIIRITQIGHVINLEGKKIAILVPGADEQVELTEPEKALESAGEESTAFLSFLRRQESIQLILCL